MLQLTADLYKEPVPRQEVDNPKEAFEGAAHMPDVAVTNAGGAVRRQAA